MRERKIHGWLPIQISLSLMVMALASTPASAQAVELTWVSFASPNTPTIKNLQKGFIDRINEMGKGKVTIKFRGGPETFPAFDQGKAVQRGIVDIAAVPVGFYESLAPGVGGAMLTQVSLEAERKAGGGYDYLNELHKKGGLHYIGRGTPSDQNFFYLTLNKKVTRKEDFAGLKLGTATAARAAVEAWGAEPVSLRLPEYFSAMERGVVDGVATSSLSLWFAQGIFAVTKYVVDQPYYQSTVAIIMNLKKWEQLSPEAQDVLTRAIILSEKDHPAWMAKSAKFLKKKMIDKGVEFYKLDPAVAKWFLKTAYDAAWDYQMKRFPEVTPKLRSLLTE